MEYKNQIVSALILCGVLALLSGCATTTAPTEASTNTFDKTSNVSLDATSSTSPGSSSSDSAKAEAFTHTNFARVKMDMATGGGEHLQSLAALLHVSPDRQDAFFTLTREKFAVLYSSEATTPHEMLARLNIELAARPELVN